MIYRPGDRVYIFFENAHIRVSHDEQMFIGRKYRKKESHNEKNINI
jgi:hypothetical protein